MKSYFKIYNTILFVIVLSMYFLVDRGIDDFVLWICLGIFYYYFIRTLLNKPLVIAAGIKTVFKLELLFMLFYYLLFYLPYQTYLLGLNNIARNDWISNTYLQYTNVSVVLSTIGLIMFMRGYEKKIEGRVQQETKWTRRHYFRLYNIILVSYGLTFAVFMATGWAVLIATYTPNTGDNTTDGI